MAPPSSPEPLPLPRLSAPAARALAGAGITELRQLDGRPESELLALHGLGPAQLGVLRSALSTHGLAFSGPVTRPAPRNRNDNTTFRPTEGSPRQWIDSLDSPRRVRDGLRLLELFAQETGAEPRLWGGSIVGYGHHHYVYDSGREGDTCRVGFSPRRATVCVYGVLGIPGEAELLARLGPHKTGAACLYFTTLDRVDEGALRELVTGGWRSGRGTC